ncbi:DUF503 domain-containing protein [Magnetofaba australis]|uniref:DUF503 domain-containing protein n=1 Tax=Magnetofaba australis IT-1 TaxID=1434232 RepID=A0A1Y2JZV1_9PROT|nr:DUF503 domain-containing protein [Magnetofaba australis]OSM00359.1 hypothetical protein MAIT1_00860 [Magnetofaba australis IT-1]
MTLRIGVLETLLELHGVHSLKAKRGVIKSLLHKIRQTHQASVAEVSHQDLWDLAGIGVVVAGNEPAALQRRLQKILDEIENDGRVQVADYQTEIL